MPSLLHWPSSYAKLVTATKKAPPSASTENEAKGTGRVNDPNPQTGT